MPVHFECPEEPTPAVPVKERLSFTPGLLDNVPVDQTAAWSRIKTRVRHEECPPDTVFFDPITRPKPEGHVRLALVSDTHNNPPPPETVCPEGGSVDLVVHAGDWANDGTAAEIAAFCEWLEAVPLPREAIIVVAGNHDTVMDAAVASPEVHGEAEESIARVKACCTYLCHESATISAAGSSVSVFGSPRTLTPGNSVDAWWAFPQRRRTAHEGWAPLSAAAPKVVVTHSPPLGHGDLFKGSCVGHIGCPDLLDCVTACKPALHVFGHCHYQPGATTNGATVFVNAACPATRRATFFDLLL